MEHPDTQLLHTLTSDEAQSNSTASQPLRIIPMGGLGEIGKNMLAIEYSDDIIVIDCGLMFPEEGMYGVDLIVPDITYLIENRNKVRGIFITHGHEDHIGALPWILPDLNVPVYAPPLACGLIKVKLTERNSSASFEINQADIGTPIRLGNFEVEPFRVCHSIPDATGLAIRTPAGLIIHTGDFKIDHTPTDGKIMDFDRLNEICSQGTFLLLSDSTYAETPGYTPSEMLLSESINRIIAEAPGRVIVATFASLISRIQQVLNAAEKNSRKVAIVGRSMVNNVNLAISMNYLHAPEGVLVPLEQLKNFETKQTLLITTGSQGEPTSVLVRIAQRNHKTIAVASDDTVIISASPIPGNETVINKTINSLSRQGAKVLHTNNSVVHVHGHASQEELKLMLRMVKPKYFIPVHGEFRHLIAHSNLAQTLGVEKTNCFVLEDGDVLELGDSGGFISNQISAGHIFVDGGTIWDSQDPLFKERRALAHDGIVVIAVVINATTGVLSHPIEFMSSGLTDDQRFPSIFSDAAAHLHTSLSLDVPQPLPFDSTLLEQKIKKCMEKYFASDVHMYPKVLPVVLQQ